MYVKSVFKFKFVFKMLSNYPNDIESNVCDKLMFPNTKKVRYSMRKYIVLHTVCTFVIIL